MSDKRPGLGPAEMLQQVMEPFAAVQAQMQRMQHEMARMVEHAWGGATGSGGLPAAAPLAPMRPAHPLTANAIAPLFGLPAADVTETPDAYTIVVELPGVPKDAVEVSAGDGVLSISGEKVEETRDQGAMYFTSERRYGRFQRAFPLPANVARDAITAEMADGVLKVVLPKSGDAKGRLHKVAVSG
jgi:HSP20 family protein